MKTVKMSKLPKCDICGKNDARYDTPLAKFKGSWGYVCVACAKSTGVNLRVGSILEEAGPPAKPSGKKVHGKEMTPIEQLIMDADREIECPECDCIRKVEPDAAYTYTCEDCGAEVKVPCIM